MEGDGRRKGGSAISKETHISNSSGVAEWEMRVVDNVLWNEGARIMYQT